MAERHALVDGAGERRRPAQLARPGGRVPLGPPVLGRVEVQVRDLAQRRGALAVDREGRLAERCRRARRELGVEAVRERGGLGRARAREEDGELVAADAPDRVARPQRGAHRPRGPAELVVARPVAEPVVRALEVVEVDEEEADRRAGATGAAQLGVEALVEPAAVERAGERVGARDAREGRALALVLARLPRAHPARRGQRQGDDELAAARHAAEDRGRPGVRRDVGHDDDDRRQEGIGERGEDRRQEEEGGQRAADAAVARGDDRDQRDQDARPGEEHRLARTRPAQDPAQRHRQHRERPPDRADRDREDRPAVRLRPGGEAVGGEVEPAEDAQSDAGPRVAQPELDVGEVWGLGAHRPVYRPRPRNLDRP